VDLTETLTASLEDYLEAIFNIIAEKQALRPKDIAKRLNVIERIAPLGGSDRCEGERVPSILA
jgi:hypothetical protein